MGQVRTTLRERVGSFRRVGQWDMGHFWDASGNQESFLKSRVFCPLCKPNPNGVSHFPVPTTRGTSLGQAWDKLNIQFDAGQRDKWD
jgi:hypothetical protein